MTPAQMVLAYWPVIAMWFALNAYVAWRLIGPLELEGWLRNVVWASGIVATILPLAALIDGRSSNAGGLWLQWAGYLVMGFASIVVLFALTRDASLLMLRALRASRKRLTRTKPAEDGTEPLADPDRRVFMTKAVNLGIVGSAGMITGAGTVGVQRIPDVKEVEVPIEGLAPQLDGFRIAQLTDVHIGPTIKGDYMRGLVEATNQLDADLVAVTGDLVDGHVPDLREHVAALSDLRSRHGSFFVTGNHEYYWNAEEWIDEVRRLGLDALINEHRVIEHDGASVTVAGVTDHRASRHIPAHRSDPKAAFANAPADCLRLLLAHQPRSIFAAQEAGADLQISGHTHGGQYFPFNVLVYLAQPFVRGLHRAKDTWIYVSCGSGYWGPPVRLGAPSEITLLKLVRVARS
jgi:hypothetical protein